MIDSDEVIVTIHLLVTCSERKNTLHRLQVFMGENFTTMYQQTSTLMSTTSKASTQIYGSKVDENFLSCHEQKVFASHNK